MHLFCFSQYVAPLNWLTHDIVIENVCSKGHQSSLELIVLSNTEEMNSQTEHEGKISTKFSTNSVAIIIRLKFVPCKYNDFTIYFCPRTDRNIRISSKLIGMDTVYSLVESCPRLTGIGNLRTWKNIDYYNAEDENYYNSDASELAKFKKKSANMNWDLDIDLENLDYIYKI